MPTNRTKRSRNRTAELTESQVEHLLTGTAVKAGFNYPEREADWQKYKFKLMEYWLSDIRSKYMKEPLKYADKIIGFAMPGGPFTRPAAWWDYEAPELRRCLNFDESKMCCYNDGLPCRREKMAQKWPDNPSFRNRKCFHKGRPWQPPRFKDGKYCPAEFETQKEYLIRLDLLTENEKTTIDQ